MKYKIIPIFLGIFSAAVMSFFFARAYRNNLLKKSIESPSADIPEVIVPKRKILVKYNDEFVNNVLGLSQIVESEPSFDKLKEKAITEYTGALGLYIKNLKNGKSYVFNENSIFYGASLYKVPVAIQVMHEVENNKITLNDNIKYLSSDYYGGSGTIQSDPLNSVYTVELLLTKLLKDSDNVAQSMLLRTIGINNIWQATYEFNGNFYSEYAAKVLTSPKEVATVFENLYLVANTPSTSNAPSTYISPESAEFLINIMGETAFDNRINIGLNHGTNFYHKIGNWPESNSWHDCGIVDNGHVYVVCVMTENTTYSEFVNISTDVGRFIEQLK